jgi:hypothetical protein
MLVAFTVTRQLENWALWGKGMRVHLTAIGVGASVGHGQKTGLDVLELYSCECMASAK